MTQRAPHILLMALLSVHPAWAQTDDPSETGSESSGLSANELTFSITPAGIAIDTCETGNTSGLAQTISVTSNYTPSASDVSDREIHLLIYTDEGCIEDLAYGDCAAVDWNADMTEICGCLETWTEAKSDNSASFDLEGIAQELTPAQYQETICSGTGKPLYLIHRGYTKDAEGDLTWEADSDAIEIVVDVTAPNTPTEAPTVVAGDAKLRVTPNYEGETPAKYEICACPNVEGGNINACTTCVETATIPTEGYTFENSISNETNYAVIFRVFDAVGNKSEASPSATGTPTQLYDFAETYESWSRGRGEKGGCAMNADETSPLSWLLLLIIVGGVSLRRRDS